MNEDYTAKIQEYLRAQGFKDSELIDDLTDHLLIEVDRLIEARGVDFNSAFGEAKTKLLPDNPYELERDLKLLTTQKNNIMIKKMAYLGGYLSALCLCIALLFGALSIQDNLRSDRQQESFDAQIVVETSLNSIEKEDRQALYEKFYLEAADLKISSLQNLERSQVLLMISILLFCVTYLPYRFYSGYQKSELEFS